MKKSKLKSMSGLVLMSLLLTAFAPTDTYAQRNNQKGKEKKVKVATPVKHYNKQPRRGALTEKDRSGNTPQFELPL